MIKLIVLVLALTSCASLRDSDISDNDFVIQENNSARPIEFDYK
jgi:hypothetical protein